MRIIKNPLKKGKAEVCPGEENSLCERNWEKIMLINPIGRKMSRPIIRKMINE
jgi:hypothetical protein